MADKDVMLAIGRLEGKMDSVISNQSRHDTSLNTINTRLRKVETKAYLNGATTGSLASIGMSFIIAKLKLWG